MSKTLSYIIAFIPGFVLMSCHWSDKKENKETTVHPHTHDVMGIYSGKANYHSGAYTTLTNEFKENNFMIGRLTPTSPANTFGGYQIKGDSIYMSVYYVQNNHYFLLGGELSNNDSTIEGFCKDLNDPDNYGSFTINKR